MGSVSNSIGIAVTRLGGVGRHGRQVHDPSSNATATFRVLYVFIILSHNRRKIVHFNVTANPCGQWAGQQIIEAFPWDEAPRFLLRDNDNIYGDDFTTRVESMDIEEVNIAPRSPWQNPYCERVIGSIR